MKIILGISAFYHDSAAVLLVNGEIVAAAQEERFTRKKHTKEFPSASIKYCVEAAHINFDEIEAIVFYEKPLLKFERLLETYYAFAPKGIVSFLTAMPEWLKSKLFLRKILKQEFKLLGNIDWEKTELLFSEHHLSHAASSFFASPFEKSAILTIDGVGEWTTASIGMGESNKIKILKELHFPHSVGLLYSSFTYFLGFTVNSGEYKLMGLAPYGNAEDDETKKFIEIIKTQLVDIKPDGSIFLNKKMFSFCHKLKMVNAKKWENMFSITRRKPEEEISQSHCNLAYSIQKVTEEIILKMAQTAYNLTKASNLCLAGGVALNCVANGLLLKEKTFKNIYIQPASGDAGGALGAALAVHYLYFENQRHTDEINDQMKGSLLGPDYTDEDVDKMNRFFKTVYKKQDNFDAMAEFIAEKIANGNIVGWFQGRMEFGPRALGNRSILGDSRNPDMQQKMNLKIKFREGFRPFAPAVLAEEVQNYFEMDVSSPYMLMVAPVVFDRRKKLANNYNELPLKEKLKTPRSDIQAVTHIDFSARIQTVHKNTNPKFYTLINAFKNITDYGIVVNTSFNVRGEPIVCSPQDAYLCFMATDMDYLVINNYIYSKIEQTDYNNNEKWKRNIIND
ncbi:MAG: carbamoyltransferase [Bacteroidales bacterium]|nr:carbamoyltransferase [Bacteroidales bacterium]